MVVDGEDGEDTEGKAEADTQAEEEDKDTRVEEGMEGTEDTDTARDSSWMVHQLSFFTLQER